MTATGAQGICSSILSRIQVICYILTFIEEGCRTNKSAHGSTVLQMILDSIYSYEHYYSFPFQSFWNKIQCSSALFVIEKQNAKFANLSH